jgi:hypothetical protein
MMMNDTISPPIQANRKSADAVWMSAYGGFLFVLNGHFGRFLPLDIGRKPSRNGSTSSEQKSIC